jgi:hypothetical protein
MGQQSDAAGQARMIRWNGLEIDRKRRTVRRGETIVQMYVNRRTCLKFNVLCALMLAGPVSASRIFDLLYENDEDGGPLSGHHIITTCMCQLRPVYTALSLKLCKDGTHYKYYWLDHDA